MPARDDASVCVTVQFRDRSWQVSVPEQWCRQHTTDVSQILRLACERDPHNVARASELSAYCFNKALWNAHNIEALLDERTIVLAEDGTISEAVVQANLVCLCFAYGTFSRSQWRPYLLSASCTGSRFQPPESLQNLREWHVRLAPHCACLLFIHV